MQAGFRTTSLLRLLLIASFVGPACILGIWAWLTYQRAFGDARRELIWTSEVALEHASKVFDSYALVADRVQDSLNTLDPGTIAQNEDVLHRRFGGIITPLPQIQSLIVLDREAHLEVATDAEPVDKSIDFSDRDYFEALKSQRVETFVSRVQTSRVTGKTFFGWGRSRQDPAGGFGGVIDIAVSPEFFTRFYATLVSEVGETATGRVVTMVRGDGQILVRYPALPGPPPKVAASNPFFDAVRNSPTAAATRTCRWSTAEPRGCCSHTERCQATRSTSWPAGPWMRSRPSGGTPCCSPSRSAPPVRRRCSC